MTKTIWVDTTGASTTYVPREKPIQESVAPFSGTISGAAPATTNLGTNSGQRILAADGTWIPQPAFTSGGADQLETLRPSVISTSYSANPPTVTDSAKAYDSDTNHATTFGQWYAAQEARTNNRVDIFSLTTWASKTQTWTAATINVSRSYAILQDGESSATSGSSSKTSSVKYEFSTNNGSSWTTLGTDTAASIPTAPQTLSMALGTLTPTMGNILVKVTITRGGGGTIYEDGVSLPGLTGEVDLKLFDVWIDGTYAGGAGNITCNNLTVTGNATFQNKIYDSTNSPGTNGQVLKVASNGKVEWATDSAGTGTVTSITTTGANGVTISGGSTQTITTSGTFALALGNITPTSISTGTGSFSGDVEFAASIKSPNGSNSPIVISPDGTGDLHVNADSLRLGDNNANATIATNGIGDLILTTNEGSTTEGIIRLYDGANGNITLTPNGTGQVQVGSDQVVTLTASQTLTNKTLSTSSTWNGNVIGSAYGGAGTVNGILKANGSGTVSAASAGTDYVTSVSVTSPVSNTGTTANPTIALASGYGDTQNPYGSKTANYFLAAPNGSAGSPTFRAIVAADIPTLNQSTTGTAANITATSNTTLTTLSSLVSIGTITTGTWNASAIGVAYGGTGLTTLTAGYIPYGNGTSAFGSSANLFWDSTNSRLGVGTSSPAYKLDVNGSVRFATGATATPILLQTGSSTQATLRFGSDGDVYSINGGQDYIAMIFNTNNTERMRITSDGSVGIANASPSYKLDVNGSVRFATGATGTPIILQTGSSTQATLRFGSSGQVYSINGGEDYTAMIFNTNGSERMRIDSSGNVGIGVTPSYALDVRKDSGTWEVIRLQNANSGSSAFIRAIGSGGGSVDFGSADTASTFVIRTNATERMRISSGGQVSINTTTVSNAKLTIDTTAQNGLDVFRSDSSANYEGIRFRSTTNATTYGSLGWDSGGLRLDGTAGTMYFSTSGTERMRIDSSGNLGIGVTPSAWKSNWKTLQISNASITSDGVRTAIGNNWYLNSSASDIYINTDYALLYQQVSGIHIWYTASSGNAGTAITFYERMRITNGGELLIGNTNGTEKLTVTGNIRASGVYVGNGSSGSYTKGFGAIQTASTTPGTPSGGAAGDHFYYY